MKVDIFKYDKAKKYTSRIINVSMDRIPVNGDTINIVNGDTCVLGTVIYRRFNFDLANKNDSVDIYIDCVIDE